MKLSYSALPAPWQRRLRIGGISLAVFLILFGLLGYFWLPGFAKAKVETLLTEKLHRPVTVERISVSPYTLSATVEGFKVGDVLAFKSLYLNISSTSLARGIPVVSEIKLVQPEIHLVRESATRLNISDLLDEWLNKPKDDEPTPEFSVSNIQIEGGHIEWDDKVAGGKQTISDIALGVPFIANVPSKVEIFVEPKFAAKINGSQLSLNGKLRPFAKGHDAQINLDLENLDLTPLTAYAKLPLKLQSLKLSSNLKVTFEKPGEGDPALKVAGDLTLSDFDLSLLDNHAKAQIGSLSLKDIQVDVFRQQASVGQVLLSKPNISLLRSGPGSLDFASLGKSNAPAPKVAAVKAPATGTATAKTTPAPAAKPWHWSVGKVGIEEGSFRFEDSTLSNALPLTVSGLSLHVGTVADNQVNPIPLSLKASVNKRGSIAVEGKASLKGNADINLDINQIELVALQGWADEKLNAVLTKGDLSFKGDVHWLDGTGDVNGDLTLGDFNILDKLNADDLLRWKTLKLSGVSVKTGSPSRPLNVNLGDVSLKDFFAKVLINSKGQLNLKDIVKHDEPVGSPAVSSATTPNKAAPDIADVKTSKGSNTSVAVVAPPAPKETAGPAPVIKVGKITVDNGTVNFTDHFIKPNYSARITGLKGRVGALAAGTLSPVELHGKVERTAPLDITGKVDPFSNPIALDIRASARSIDLPSFSAYSGRYVGYAIEKGKLSVEVGYKIDKGLLTADNHIFLDQLTFGDKVESKDALNLPVNLAVALLRNGRGEIDINLPISGSLNDPQFSVGGIILKVLGNLIVKAVTAPFALLGSLFGGGEDLSQIDFPAGLTLITPEMEGRLQSLSKAMVDRPALKLEITGMSDPATDRTGYRRALLDRKMRTLKQADLARQGKAGGKLSDVQISKEEYPVYLEKVYKAEDFKEKPRYMVGIAKGLPTAEMETLLLTYLPADDSDLLALGEDRGQRVQTWLAEKGNVPLDRIFLRSARLQDSKDKAAGGRVVFSLK
ncbi:MAG TPA: DUF748 domain-containing protein [Rhodocyclaceae bacterium]|jgi:hypothetical protein